MSASETDVLVLGNYQATWESYQRVLDGTIGGFAVTWRALRTILAGVSPSRVFLTNADIGLPDGAKDTAPFPVTRSFLERCAPIDELASQFGVSSTPIRRVLSEAGVEFRRRSWREVGLFDVDELVRRYEAGESKLQLARELNVNTMSVHRRLVAAGVKIASTRRSVITLVRVRTRSSCGAWSRSHSRRAGTAAVR